MAPLLAIRWRSPLALLNEWPGIVAVDLFCGVGGLTHGLAQANIDVRLGVDVDPTCAYPYEANNRAQFLEKSVEDLCASELRIPHRAAAVSG